MIMRPRSWTAQELSSNLPPNDPRRDFWEALAAMEFRINTMDGSGYTATWNFSGRGWKMEGNTMKECLEAALAVIDTLTIH